MSRGQVREYHDDPSSSTYQGSGYTDAAQLRDAIRNNLYRIKNNVTNLERLLKSWTGNDRSVPGKLHQVEQEINHIAEETTKLFQQLSSRPQDKVEKTQFEKVREEYQTVLKKYSALQKEIVQQVRAKETAPSSDAIGWDDEDEDDQRQFVEARKQQLAQQQQEIDIDIGAVVEREQRVRQIESDILDINSIFRDLAVMVEEQGSLVDNIEDNVYQAADQVEEGKKQLDLAKKYQSKYRKKLCCLVVIFVIIAGVLALILGLTLGRK